MARKPAFIRWSREREAAIQSRMLDVLERRFRRRLADEIAREMRFMSGRYALLGSIPSPSEQHQSNIRDIYRDMAEASARTFGQRILTQGKAAGFVVETKEEEGFAAFFRRLALEWISQEGIRRRITSIAETTRNQITDTVLRGQRDGLGVDAIAQAINERTPAIARWRGALIARTETHGAANYASHETAKSTGLDLLKEWVSVEDYRTRAISRDDQYDHVAMDGQTREMDEHFEMPNARGEPLKIMFPGEAGMPGAATINCRCTVVHQVKGLDD